MCRWSVVFVLFSVVCGAVWKPSVHDTWQWELSSGHIDTSANAHVFDIDLFDADQSAIDKLHSMGRKVICYFSAGSYENWRPDKNEFPSDVLGNNLEDWEGEKWLDIRDDRVKAIMRKRLDKAVSRRCDGVEPDNVDGYSNNNGLGLKASDQLSYNKWLASEAHSRSLSVGLKNDVDQITSLVSHFDWALNEECVQYNECNKYQPFFDAGKAVFHVEYVDNHSQGSHKRNQVCHSSHRPRQLITLIKDWDLTKWRLTC